MSNNEILLSNPLHLTALWVILSYIKEHFIAYAEMLFIEFIYAYC